MRSLPLALLHRDQALAAGLRGFGLRIRLHQFLDRLARRLGVLQLGLAVRDREQRFGRLRVVGRGADEAAEGR